MLESRMNRKVPVRFGAGEKLEITSKAYLWLSLLLRGAPYDREQVHLRKGQSMENVLWSRSMRSSCPHRFIGWQAPPLEKGFVSPIHRRRKWQDDLRNGGKRRRILAAIMSSTTLVIKKFLWRNKYG